MLSLDFSFGGVSIVYPNPKNEKAGDYPGFLFVPACAVRLVLAEFVLFAVGDVFQSFADLEFDDIFRFDCQRSPGQRVAASAGFLMFHFKGAEPDELNGLARSDGRVDTGDKGRDSFFSFGFGHTLGLGDMCDKILTIHSDYSSWFMLNVYFCVHYKRITAYLTIYIE
nr:hypothetical protein K5LAMBDA5_LOCUS60 [Klebsiella phage vB_Ko_K5lambda5]